MPLTSKSKWYDVEQYKGAMAFVKSYCHLFHCLVPCATPSLTNQLVWVFFCRLVIIMVLPPEFGYPFRLVLPFPPDGESVDIAMPWAPNLSPRTTRGVRRSRSPDPSDVTRRCVPQLIIFLGTHSIIQRTSPSFP